jgi:hypothetical protein
VLHTHLKQLLVLGLAGTASLLLSSCESTTTPAPRGGTNISNAPQLAVATSAVAQAVVVVGTGDPAIDVPAVQAAVDQGGDVILKGHFSFRTAPTVVVPLVGYPQATVLVSKSVTITGGRERGDGEMTTIDGGSIPFFVSAAGARVSIERLRFVRPVSDAVLVYAVSGLDIASCEIEGLEPFQHGAEGIGINTSGNPPTPTSPGNPGNVSGTIRVVHNDIDVLGGTPLDNTLGVVAFSLGVPGAPVQVFVSGNAIKNSTARAINLYQVSGQARVERNDITTSTIVGPAGGIAPEAIHITGSGSYLVARNFVHSRWATGAGIRVHSQFSAWPIVQALVENNDVFMDAPAGTVFGTNSAGIDIWGNAQDNVVRHNRIRGRARAALAVNVFKGGVPANNAFINNRFRGFEASLADLFVGPGATGTRIVGRGTVDDQGTGTIIVSR